MKSVFFFCNALIEVHAKDKGDLDQNELIANQNGKTW